MAMTGVLRPGHVQIRVLDLDESVKWYTDVMGLQPVGRENGRALFKTYEERDAHSVILRQDDRAGIDLFGFKVLDKATLDAFEGKLNDYGVKTERIPAGELPDTGERVRFDIPTGHTIELYADKKSVGNNKGFDSPEVTIIDGPGIRPIRMDHCLLYGGDLDATHALFENVLGFSLCEQAKLEDNETNLAIWLTCSAKAHDIAFARHEKDSSLHHVAFLLPSWEQVLRAADIMSINRVPIDIGPTRHGITQGTTIYFWDPSGNRLETFCGGYDFYPDMEPTTWSWEEVGRGIFYHDRKLNDTFLTVIT